ncbi:MAG: serine--tRNA ligase, partial [Patescibacteria group bacterium]
MDLKFLRENIELVKKGLAKKHAVVDVDEILELDKKHRELLRKTEALRAEQNKAGEQIAKLKGTEKETELAKMKEVKGNLKTLEAELAELEPRIEKLVRQIPNPPQDDVPEGKDERDNVVVREWGKKPEFSFTPKSYIELGEKLDLIDTERAAKVSGSRFGYLKNEAALLEWALVRLAFDITGKENFVPIIPPVMIKSESMDAMGYIDTERDKEERYFFEKDDLYLVGTSEQSIGPMHKDEIFKEKDLPKRYAGFSTCFRREAGSYGKDTKGILRVHQFDKVEMFSFCLPEKSKDEHLLLLGLEEKLMQALGLHYRVVHLCAGDIAKPSASTYDI